MLNQAIVDEWLEEYRSRVLGAFGERVAYIGCQGSWGRGEGRPDSDIDAVTILDRMEPADLAAYRDLIGAMPHSKHGRTARPLYYIELLEQWAREMLTRLASRSSD